MESTNKTNFSFRSTTRMYDNFVADGYFKDYDYYEIFSPDKTYETTEYTYDYGKGTRRYINELASFTNGGVETASYVAAREVISDDEIDELIPYCQCYNHLNPTQPMCSCCVGCLMAYDVNPSPRVVNLSRIAKSKSEPIKPMLI